MFGKNEIVGRRFFKETPENKLMVTSMFQTLQGEGPYRGMPAFFIRLSKCNLACSFCFVPSTPILMGDGKNKRIDKIEIGDEVMSWDGEKFITKKVINKFINPLTKLLRVTAGNKKVWVTPEHPFLTSNRGWVEAKDLTTADILVNFSSSERMKLFNPQYDAKNRPTMTKEMRKKQSKRMRELWNRPEFVEQHNDLMTKNNPMKNPEVAYKGFVTRENRGKTVLEKRFEQACSGLPIEYTGSNINFHVAHKVLDYKVTDKNKLIEIWASDAPWAQYRNEDWIKQRTELFEKNGYETLFLPINQNKFRNEKFTEIREQVSRFIHNGKRITEVIEVTDEKAIIGIYGSKSAERLVYNIEVEDTHTYVANSLVVHNCDTFFDDGDWLTFEEIEEKIETTMDQFYKKLNMPRPEFTKHNETKKKDMVLVLTGGEPTLQKNIGPFLERMNLIFKNTQIESNGIIHEPSIPDSTTLVISPKCLEENGVSVRYIQPNLKNMEIANCLKFVMEANPESPYSNVPEWVHEWKAKTGREVFISPMNVYNSEPQKSKQLRMTKNRIELEERSTVDEVVSFWEEGLLDMKANQINHEYAAQYCIKFGFILNLQIHLYASLA